MTSEPVIVRVLKYDGTVYRTWTAQLREIRDQLLILDAAFEVDVQHESLGTIPKGTRTIEYYWLDRWYNIFQFLEDDGRTKLFYCNINTPPAVEEGVLRYVDLDIDVLVRPDLSYEVLDLEEFEDNARRYGYSEASKKGAQTAVNELKEMIEGRQFPFDSELSISR
jgi:uncharacterized protein